MFSYIKVTWTHDSASEHSEPIIMYSELDVARFERRKVEVYKNGNMGFAGGNRQSIDTVLGSVPVPPLQEIANDKFGKFNPIEISKADFEHVWELALSKVPD